MKKVVLFKSESEEYKDAFSAAEFTAVFVEPLQFEAVNAARLAARLARPYAGLVLCSPRAVAACAAVWDPARFVLWSARRVYTVGPATARDIKRELGLDSRGETSGNAENLAKVIIDENPKASELLFPCGNLSSETLPRALAAADIAVEPLPVYETRESVHLRRDLMNLNSEHEPCCLVFFSPSGCEYIHRQLQTFANGLSQLPHFAIGDSTAHKIENLGLEIAGVAARPRADSLVEAVRSYFTATRGDR